MDFLESAKSNFISIASKLSAQLVKCSSRVEPSAPEQADEMSLELVVKVYTKLLQVAAESVYACITKMEPSFGNRKRDAPAHSVGPVGQAMQWLLGINNCIECTLLEQAGVTVQGGGLFAGMPGNVQILENFHGGRARSESGARRTQTPPLPAPVRSASVAETTSGSGIKVPRPFGRSSSQGSGVSSSSSQGSGIRMPRRSQTGGPSSEEGSSNSTMASTSLSESTLPAQSQRSRPQKGRQLSDRTFVA